MANLTLSQISAAVDAAYQTTLALPQPQRVALQQIADNCTLRTDVYNGPKGSGFIVAATVDLKWRKLMISKQHGPETQWEQPAPALEILLKWCDEKRAAAYESRGCSTKDFVDAVTKESSTDPTEQTAGTAQRLAVLAARLQVKSDFPKPQ